MRLSTSVVGGWEQTAWIVILKLLWLWTYELLPLTLAPWLEKSFSIWFAFLSCSRAKIKLSTHLKTSSCLAAARCSNLLLPSNWGQVKELTDSILDNMLHCNNRSEFKNTWKGIGSVTGNCRLDGTPPETLLPVLRKESSWEYETKPCGPRFVSKCLTLKGVVDLSFLVGLDAVAPGANSPGFSRWKTCDKNFFRCLHG